MTTESAAVGNYDAMIEALAARKAALGLSDESLDALIGWASGYTGKLMGITPSKRLGIKTMFECVQALGFEITLREIPGYVAKVQQRCGKRDERRVVTANVRTNRIPWLFKPENAREMVVKRHSATDANDRSEHARRMNAVRWRGHVSKPKKQARRERARAAAMARWKQRRIARKERIKELSR